MTFLFNSIWHGVDLGYLCFFVVIGLNAYLYKLFSSTKVAKIVLSLVPWPALVVPLWTWSFF